MSRPMSSRRASPRDAGGPAGRAAGAAVKRHSRAERAKQIERLERRGLGTREIGAKLGLARSTVNIYRVADCRLSNTSPTSDEPRVAR